MEERVEKTPNVELRISQAEARSIANLLRYTISLNTTVGLVSPTERRLATPTYKAAELAALALEGKTFGEALQEAHETWTGSLEQDHRHALKTLETTRETIKQAMSGRLGPEQLAEYLEVTQDQFLQLIRRGLENPRDI